MRRMPEPLARLLPRWLVSPLPGNNKEEAIIAAAIDYTASLNFHGNATRAMTMMATTAMMATA
jgi:hypothetical protein